MPTWGQLKEMAEEIKVLCPDIGVRASYETFYALNYLQSIVSDPATDGSPIHD